MAVPDTRLATDSGAEPAYRAAPSAADYFWLLLLAVILGSNFMFIKIAVTQMPPFFFSFSRLAIAALILIALMVLAGRRFPRGRIWLPLVGSALFGYALPFALISWGQQRVDAGVTAILMATMPLFTLLLAQFFTRDEKPSRWTIIGFCTALSGIFLLFGFDKLLSLADQSLRQYAIALAAISYGVNAIISKQLVDLDWRQMAASLMAVAVILSAPLLLLVEWPLNDIADNAWWALIYSSIIPTAYAAILIVQVVQRQGASFLSLINFIVPVVGVFCAVLFLGETLPSNAWLALIVILVGVAIARRRPKPAIKPATGVV